MQTPIGVPYEVVAIEGKGRGVIASQDNKAGQTTLVGTT